MLNDENFIPPLFKRTPWNKGKLIGPEPPRSPFLSRRKTSKTRYSGIRFPAMDDTLRMLNR
jgi:hypothetical protein